MKTIEEVYRERLQLLIEEAGSQAKLAKLIGKGASQISQWINRSPDSKTGKPRVLSREIAREIEKLMGKPLGWMDQPIANSDSAFNSSGQPDENLNEANDASTEKKRLLEALETIRLAILASDIAGSKALAGVFASFVEEPDKTTFRDSLATMLAKRPDAAETELSKAA